MRMRDILSYCWTPSDKTFSFVMFIMIVLFFQREKNIASSSERNHWQFSSKDDISQKH